MMENPQVSQHQGEKPPLQCVPLVVSPKVLFWPIWGHPLVRLPVPTPVPSTSDSLNPKLTLEVLKKPAHWSVNGDSRNAPTGPTCFLDPHWPREHSSHVHQIRSSHITLVTYLTCLVGSLDWNNRTETSSASKWAIAELTASQGDFMAMWALCGL